MATISGMVCQTSGKKGIPYATIRAYEGGQTLYASSDNNGRFSLDLPNNSKWDVIAFDKGGFASDHLTYDMSKDHSDTKIFLERIADTEDEKAGRIFFWTVLGIFIGLVALYLFVHLYKPDVGQGFKFWSQDPLRYLEILLWGLAGILVSKIINSSLYLRKHRFYRGGILMHIAHLVATPLLVLVTVLLLSQVTLTFRLTSTNEITIDLSNPMIMVAFAFIIGTSPWPLWNFIQNNARRFTSQFD